MVETTIATILALVFGLMAGTAYSLLGGYFLFNPFRKVQLMRRVLRKNYGIIHFKYGKDLLPIVKNLEGDVIKAFKGIWIIEQGKIYHQVDSEKSGVRFDHPSDDIDKAKITNFRKLKIKGRSYTVEKAPIELRQADINFKQGVPVLFLDVNDLKPLKFEGDAIDEDMSRNPEQVEATMAKEIAAAEAEAIKLNKEKMVKYMKYALIASILSLMVILINIYFQFIGFGNIEVIVEGIQTTLNARPIFV